MRPFATQPPLGDFESLMSTGVPATVIGDNRYTSSLSCIDPPSADAPVGLTILYYIPSIQASPNAKSAQSQTQIVEKEGLGPSMGSINASDAGLLLSRPRRK